MCSSPYGIEIEVLKLIRGVECKNLEHKYQTTNLQQTLHNIFQIQSPNTQTTSVLNSFKMVKVVAAIIAIAGLSSMAYASPLAQKDASDAVEIDARADTCNLFPWFIQPYQGADCTGAPQKFQPASGPYTDKPVNKYCQPLSGGQPGVQAFNSVSVNPTACSPLQSWKINLYMNDDKCVTKPITVEKNQCVAAPSGAQFTSFDAIVV
ncbi:hypothetical protein EDD36DRAFT_153065 [Exophiala viscosa]|uniref:Uncharacterized protein n=1 Tax=Exophiala viscosa TaxID=2486360 RepID=A0AAN6IJ17_9EURO|nr:hypothetical protein EDD36DRAFT_153065 [Exophiala viscosa]